MVFFICTHCGASLKKNKVEKHYSTQCHNFPSVSCMDCHKDFRGNDYVSHTKCITEDEKYSAKGFVPKPTSNKGECKQQEWLNTIRSVHQSGIKLPAQLKTVLDAAVNVENVPRKKNKFVNFIKNLKLKIDQSSVDQLWDLLEKEHKLTKEKSDANNISRTSENQSETSPIKTEENVQMEGEDDSERVVKMKQGENVNGITSELKAKENGLSKKDKKLKRKSDASNISRTSENQSETSLRETGENVQMEIEDVSERVEKVKQGENDNEIASGELKSKENGLSKKEKKLKRKKEKYETELHEIENTQHTEIQSEEDEGRKKKKKKSKKTENINEQCDKVEQNSHSLMASEEIAEPVKKKKMKHNEDELQIKEFEQQTLSQENESSKKFKWNEVVVSIVESKGGEIPLKRLQKRVITEYQNCFGEVENVEKLTAKFNKKVLKIPGIKVHKEIVKIS